MRVRKTLKLLSRMPVCFRRLEKRQPVEKPLHCIFHCKGFLLVPLLYRTWNSYVDVIEKSI